MIEYLQKYLESNKLEEGIKQLKKGVPVQYIIGNVNFLGNIINVDSNVLIPRFETELLVQKTADYIKKYFSKNIDIIDLGTGSGAIAISLKKIFTSHIDAVDISSEALNIARKNAIQNKVEINFIQNDMLEGIQKKYDIIISNPPYISDEEEVEDIVKNNEPNIALYAKNKGLEFYEKILKKSPNNIKKEAIIAFEIGQNQANDIIGIANQYLPNSEIKIEKDLTGRIRYIFIFIGLKI